MGILLKNITLNNEKKDILIENNFFLKISDQIKTTVDKTIDCTNKVIQPAFYNTHTHAAMSLLRGLGDDKELFSWLSEDIWPIEAKLTDKDVYIGTKFAILEMIKSGTVFFNDMYFSQAAIMEAINEMGIRGAVSIVEFDMFNKSDTEKKKKATMDFLKLDNPCKDRIIKTISCHSIYTVSEELLSFASKIAKENNMYLHIHASETKKEVDDCIKKYGISPIEKLEKLDLLTSKTILAHCVHLSDKDIEIINKHNVKIAHCPISNLKLNSGKMALQKMLDKGCFITLGTDGSSSNNSLSMIDEMKIAALSAKDQDNSPTAGKSEDIFKIATNNGAKAFNINAGEIREGMLADFVLYDLNNYHLQPNYNIISNIVYSADNSAITDVFCNGKHIMKNGKVKNEEKIITDFKNCFKNLINFNSNK